MTIRTKLKPHNKHKIRDIQKIEKKLYQISVFGY